MKCNTTRGADGKPAFSDMINTTVSTTITISITRVIKIPAVFHYYNATHSACTPACVSMQMRNVNISEAKQHKLQPETRNP